MLPLESKREKVDIFPGCFGFLCQFPKKCSMFDFLQYYALDALSRGKRSALFSESSRAEGVTKHSFDLQYETLSTWLGIKTMIKKQSTIGKLQVKHIPLSSKLPSDNYLGNLIRQNIHCILCICWWICIRNDIRFFRTEWNSVFFFFFYPDQLRCIMLHSTLHCTGIAEVMG